MAMSGGHLIICTNKKTPKNYYHMNSCQNKSLPTSKKPINIKIFSQNEMILTCKYLNP